MARRRKITDGQIAKARKMREDGMFYKEVALAMDIPCSTLHVALNPVMKERNRIRTARYGETHKAQKSAYEKQRWGDNRKREQARFAIWYMNNKARDNRKSTEYRKAHLPEDAAARAARRALIIGVTIGSLAEIKEIYRRAREGSRIRCYLCGKVIPKGHRHVDHIMPLSKGGKHRPSNLAIACDFCNMSKHDKMPEEVGVLL